MGKTRRDRRGTSVRQNPMAGPPSSNAENPIAIEGAFSPRFPKVSLLVKLESGSEEDRSRAAASLAALCDNSEERQEVVTEGGVGPLIAHLTDVCMEVRLSCIGALRNMVASEEESLIQLIVQGQAVSQCLLSLQQAMQERAKMEGDASELLVDRIVEHATLLLCTLCEFSERAVEEVTASGATEHILASLESAQLPHLVALSFSQLLMVLTEDNTVLRNTVDRHRLELLLGNSRLADSSCIALATALLNMTSKDELAEIVHKLLDVIEKVVRSFNSYLLSTHNDGDFIEGDGPHKLREGVSTLDRALELLSNLCAGETVDIDDGGEGWEEETEGADSQMGNGEEAQVINDMTGESVVARVMGTNLQEQIRLLLTDAMERMQKLAISSKKLEFLHVFSRETLCKTFDAVGNISLCDNAKHDHVEVLLGFRSLVLMMAGSFTSEEDATSLEAATRCLCGLTKAVIAADKELIRPQEEHVTFFTGAVTSSLPDYVKEPIVSFLGILGAAFQQLDMLTLLLQAFSAALPSASLSLAAEILDALFDVFAEDEHNHLLAAGGSIEALNNYAPHFKNMIRSSKGNVEPETLAKAKDAHLNLVRFIRYKRQHM